MYESLLYHTMSHSITGRAYESAYENAYRELHREYSDVLRDGMNPGRFSCRLFDSCNAGFALPPREQVV